MIKPLTKILIVLGMLSFGALPVYAQQSSKIEDLRNRVSALEEYVQTMQTAMNEFSKDLVRNVDEQLQAAKAKTVVLNPLSRKVSKIDTNTGTLLISVQKMEKIDKGYRLYLQVGNPNAASYGDAKIRLFWGDKWEEQFAAKGNTTYQTWRQSLTGAEYVYSGLLEAGTWTDIAVDLKPAEYNQLQYIECAMEFNTVKLQRIKGTDAAEFPAAQP